MFQVKRVYEAASRADGFRVLVDRLWARGLSKQKARVDLWLRDIAPSNSLRKWYAHDPQKWTEFKKRYARELEQQRPLLEKLRELEKQHGTITLLFGTREERFNNAFALAAILRHGRKG